MSQSVPGSEVVPEAIIDFISRNPTGGAKPDGVLTIPPDGLDRVVNQSLWLGSASPWLNCKYRAILGAKEQFLPWVAIEKCYRRLRRQQ